MFKVGDRIIMKDGAPYGVTRAGMTGIVCAPKYPLGPGEVCVTMDLDLDRNRFSVDIKWVELLDKSPKVPPKNEIEWLNRVQQNFKEN